MQSYFYAKKRINEIERRLKSITAAAKKLPEGRLNVSESNGMVQNYHVIGKRGDKDYRRIYLGKSKQDLIEQLALKEYYKSEYYDLLREKEMLQPLLMLENPSKLNQFHYRSEKYGQYVMAGKYQNFDADKWMHEDYPSSAPFQENRTHKAIGGTMVRSKAEEEIIHLLRDKNIPYRYECDLYVGGDYVACPDFTLIKPGTMEVYYFEHFGRMDDPIYVHRNINKIQKYIDHGIYPMINLLISSETKDRPLDITLVDKMLDHFILE